MEIKDVSRRELKYVISQADSCGLYKLFSQVLHQDIHNSFNQGYMVRSLYFDTIDDTDYIEKGMKIEKKFVCAFIHRMKLLQNWR